VFAVSAHGVWSSTEEVNGTAISGLDISGTQFTFQRLLFKKNVFENFQKVALNITVMDDIGHQITLKIWK
jgi:hypothetical protein